MVPTIQVQGFQGDIARTLQARHDSSPCADRGMDVVAIQGTTIGRADCSGPRGNGYDESGVQFTLAKTDIHAIAFEPGVAGRLGGHCYSEVSGTLRKDAGDNQMAVAFQATDYASGAFEPVDQLSPITTSADRTRAAPIQVSGIPALSRCVTTGEGKRQDPEFTTMIPGPMQVRRLTPVECARLQGFPDHHARIPWRKHPSEECPDGPQYKAYGNSMAVPVMAFIGKRLDKHLKAAT